MSDPIYEAQACEIAKMARSISALESKNDRLRELFYEAWDWMQRARYDGSIRSDEMDEIGTKAVELGLPDFELGIEVDE